MKYAAAAVRSYTYTVTVKVSPTATLVDDGTAMMLFETSGSIPASVPLTVPSTVSVPSSSVMSSVKSAASKLLFVSVTTNGP